MSASVSGSKRSWARGIANPQVGLVVLIVVLACYRFSLIGSGHFYYNDEWAYDCATPLIDHLAAGEYFYGMIELFKPLSRPGFVVVSVLPTLLQRAVGASVGIGRDTLQYYDAVSAFNVLVTLAVTWCVYALGRIWLRSSGYALLLAVVHALLCNSNVWIRHMVPYYDALLPGLVALWIVSCESRSRKEAVCRALAGGLLSAWTYATYMGFSPLVVINAVVLLAVARHRLATAAAYAGASVAVIGGFELLARSVGDSYVHQIAHHQERMATWTAAPWNQGASEEGFVFVVRYLRDVEGLIGVTLLALFAGFAVLFLWRRQADIPRAARAGIIAAIGCYLLYATLAVVFHRAVFYGRFLTLYLPFLVGGAILTLKHIPAPTLRRVGVGGLALVSAASFVSFARRYAAVDYPADFLARTMTQHGIDAPRPQAIAGLTPEFAMVADGLPGGFPGHLAPHDLARTSTVRFIAVNFKHMDGPEQYTPFVPPDGYRLIAERPHPTAYPWPGYETLSPRMRQRYVERQYTMRIYERFAVAPVPQGHARADHAAFALPQGGPWNGASHSSKVLSSGVR